MEGLVWYVTNDLARLVSQEVGAECGMSSVAVFCSTVKAARCLGGLDTRDEQAASMPRALFGTGILPYKNTRAQSKSHGTKAAKAGETLGDMNVDYIMCN